MKQIYSNESRLLSMNAKNILEAAGIRVVMKNWYDVLGGLKLLVDDSAYEKAIDLLKSSEQS